MEACSQLLLFLTQTAREPVAVQLLAALMCCKDARPTWFLEVSP